MNISVLSSLRSKGHVKAGTFARAVTRKGFCYFRKTSQKTCYYSFLSASLFLPSPSSFGYISKMIETSSKKFQRPYLALSLTSTVRFHKNHSRQVQSFLISSRQLKTPGINTLSFDTVTITHPFHPHFKMQFYILSIQQCWGEGRMRYRDEKGAIRTVPLSWTDHKPYDKFLEQSSGRSIVHIKDLAGLR
jgi:hypothetical protein